MNNYDWIINIEILADEVATIHGYHVVYAVFSKYGARGLYSLSPSYFSAVFSELQHLSTEI